MITATSTIWHNSGIVTFPGLLLLRTRQIPEFGYRNSFVMNTRLGRRLIVADLHNRFFPLELVTYADKDGVHLVVNNFALFYQPHGLFLTSLDRVSCRKFDDTPGLMLVGQCHRTVDGKHDLFRFTGPLLTASRN